MQASASVVSEDMGSVDICAVINGVVNVEEAVTTTLTLTGSTKTGKDCTSLDTNY